MGRSMAASRASSLANDEESVPLSYEFTKDESPLVQTQKHGRKVITLGRIYVCALHILIVVMGGMLWRNQSLSLSLRPSEGRSWSPAHEFVEYEVNGDYGLSHEAYSAYAGPPTPEQEDAWDQLVRPAFFHATLEEFQRSGETMERTPVLTRGGWPATIGVYHELHCLRRLRLYLYRDRYYPNLTEAQENYLHLHSDHCLESLRHTVMCHGNTAMYSFAWDDPPSYKPATKSNAKSVCAKWSSIEGWARSRMIPTNPDYTHPDYS
ncbi:hypothetical protein F4677DRAFT_356290 [Hypoxylon crocopeplum]|nr:hypothetical protein F4677DRAFT_356290 [Hypoxylon crocopeplum]